MLWLTNYGNSNCKSITKTSIRRWYIVYYSSYRRGISNLYLNTGLSATGYSFDWYFNGGLIAGANAPTYTADEVGLYSVIVTNTTTTCESEEVFATVDFVNPATSFSTVVTEAFTNNATITVSVPDGTGTLLYQLDEACLSRVERIYRCKRR